ncbi:MAG: hypothetical protein HXO42_11110 [Prevotella sp.]|uniref:hypothetical protein n=1 Tax=Prevotella sp. TaxID=59823 RepID=UPI001CB61EFF|nr:hypothetical protein [Prevotella sp.]MBF1621006.1 hypothetical protein [Prevotella sp.]
MKNYLKPYTECTKVESEGYLLAGGSKDTPGAGNGPITPGTPGGGKGQSQIPPINNSKTTKSYSPNPVGDAFSFNTKDEE